MLARNLPGGGAREEEGERGVKRKKNTVGKGR